MSTTDRIYALLDMLEQYRSGALKDDVVVDVPVHSILPPKLQNPLYPPRPVSKSGKKLSLAKRTKEIIDTRPPNPPPKPYEPRSRMHSNFPLLKKPNFTRNYMDTDARLSGISEGAQAPKARGSIAPIQTLAKKLSPPRSRSLHSNDNDEYKDITVADIDHYGMYEMMLRGDVPKDADLGPVFFGHPRDVRPTLIARVLETREEIQSATQPRIREDVPRHFSTIKFDFDLLDQALQAMPASDEYDISFINDGPTLHKLEDASTLGQTEGLVTFNISSSDKIDRSPNVETVTVAGIKTLEKGTKPALRNAQKPPLNNLFKYPSEYQDLQQLGQATITIKNSAHKRKYSYMLSHEFVYDFNIPIVDGKILTNTNVYQAMMVQYAFISSYIGYIIDTLQRLFRYTPPFNGHINGNNVISLALSSYFKPFVNLSSLSEEAYISLVLTTAATPLSLQTTATTNNRDAASATIIQTYYRMLCARRNFIFACKSKRASLLIQTYGRRRLALDKVERLRTEKSTNMDLVLLNLKATLKDTLTAETEKLAVRLSDLTINQNQCVHDLMISEASFWKKAFRIGYTPDAYIYCIIIATRPCNLCNQKVLLGQSSFRSSDNLSQDNIFLRHDLYSLSFVDFSLLVDPRLHILALCDGEYTGISEIKLALQRLYRDAIPLSKLDVSRITILDDPMLLDALKEHRMLTKNTNLLLDLQFGRTRAVFKHSISNAISRTGGSLNSLVFYMPYAHQQFDKNYKELSYLTGIPIYSHITHEALQYTNIQEKLKSDQKFISLSSSSIDRSRSRGPERVASFGVAPTQNLSTTEVKNPASWTKLAVHAMTSLKYSSVIIRPGLMCYLPGCDILGDSLGGLACGMSELDKDGYKAIKTNTDLIKDITISFPYKRIDEKCLIHLYTTTGAVLQCIPVNENVIRYITFTLYVDTNAQYVVIGSYAEVPSYSYFPVGKLMSACYVSPALGEVEIFRSTVGLFASTIATAYHYSGYMTLSFAMTNGYKYGTDRGVICPRLIFNGVTYGLTTRILTTVYQSLLGATAYDYNLMMTSVGNSLVTNQNRFALIELVMKVKHVVSAAQRTTTELNIVVGGWTLEDVFTAGNAVLSIIQRESGCEEVIKEILEEQMGNLHSQQKFEELGSSPFYVCGLNSIVHGKSASSK
ncbi:Hypothetical protein GLP15_664 [Giardia lamblia P15]|uniref:Uncharacterized protein n=1 Tax=Giardia intestinalis (strain P15) TaxID=658858 RepID=E1F5C7_GIAIA|nr:Hypothetical protein GLP15_664 [Giardia lamblia P15]